MKCKRVDLTRLKKKKKKSSVGTLVYYRQYYRNSSELIASHRQHRNPHSAINNGHRLHIWQLNLHVVNPLS